MPIQITLDDVLRRKDMSRRELSRRTGVHRDTVCKYAGNRVRIISLDLLEAVCAELQCGLNDLLTDQPEPTAPRPGVTLQQGFLPPRVRSSPVRLPTWPDGRPI